MRNLIIGMILLASCHQQPALVDHQKHYDMDSLKVTHINPDGLIKNLAFTNVIAVEGSGKTIYIGEMNANDADGKIVGKGDLKVQTEQVLKNIKAALAAAGAKPEHVIKWNLHVVQGQDLRTGFEAFQSAWGQQGKPPVITMAFVAGLANPDYLVGMDAIAVVPG